MTRKVPDILWLDAKIEMISADKGGRSTWVSIGYRPVCTINSWSYEGVLAPLELVRIKPGEKAAVRVMLMSREKRLDKEISVGDQIELMEGNQRIALGRVSKILDYEPGS